MPARFFCHASFCLHSETTLVALRLVGVAQQEIRRNQGVWFRPGPGFGSDRRATCERSVQFTAVDARNQQFKGLGTKAEICEAEIWFASKIFLPRIFCLHSETTSVALRLVGCPAGNQTKSGRTKSGPLVSARFPINSIKKTCSLNHRPRGENTRYHWGNRQIRIRLPGVQVRFLVASSVPIAMIMRVLFIVGAVWTCYEWCF